MPYPDFLGIGVQKSGTSWMHYQFKKHPDINMPPVKELHHFERSSDTYRIKDIFKKTQRGKFIRSIVIRAFFSFNNFLWCFKYLFFKCTDENYKFLFSKKKSQVCGEFTPAYARLKEERIADIASLMPDCKLIYLIRNPIDRVWSHIKMAQRRGDKYGLMNSTEILELKKETIYQNSCNSLHLGRWESCFPSEQFFIGFFDQISEEPSMLLSSVYSFLGVRNDAPGLYTDLKKKVNKGKEDQIPIELERELTLRFMPELEYLNERFNNKYTKKWLKRALEVKNN